MTASASTFAWPASTHGTHAATPAFRRDLGVRLSALMKARGLDVAAVAEAFDGKTPAQKGRERHRVRRILAGKVAPQPKGAKQLAKFFDLSLAQLAGEAANGAGAEASGTEGAGRGKRAAPVMVPAPPLPRKAPPLRLAIKTYKGHADFVAVDVSGTLHVDKAMSLLALLRS